jgi:hypothetical protein
MVKYLNGGMIVSAQVAVRDGASNETQDVK